jgi:tRNA pseudouridine38-40 synthase
MSPHTERTYRMELQYDGAGLHGWAKQPGLLTVEGALETALRTVLGRAPALQVAGRTDAGVHARRQVVSLALPAGADLDRMRMSLNALTPPGIAVTRIAPAPRGFDARHQAVSRSYRYYVCDRGVVPPFWKNYCWAVYGAVDHGLLRDAAELVKGQHDFTAFTPMGTEHVFFERTVLKCAWRRTTADLAGLALGSGARVGRGTPAGRGGDSDRGLLYLEIEADAFLRHMVRALVGTMFEIAQGKRTLDDLRRLLAGAPRDDAGITAPPHGLFLWDVRYARGQRPSISARLRDDHDG